MKSKIPKFWHFGFTLIELLVVFSLAVIFAVVTIPSYINFNREQEVKQSALFLKSQIRKAQNSSLSGEKSTTSCTQSDVLTGFFVELAVNQKSFVYGGRCGDIDFNKTTLKLPSSNTKISGFYDATSLPTPPCSAFTPGNGSLRLNYRPVAKGIDFYDWNSAIASGSNLNYGKIAIKISDANANDYFIIISSGGEIYDTASC
ncbi:type II secretion system protein [Candidatus Gottesmanbacteria bacterium]|nr:type II secretion system protein [Candidatus Gottesmanbacteria bacterium]